MTTAPRVHNETDEDAFIDSAHQIRRRYVPPHKRGLASNSNSNERADPDNASHRRSSARGRSRQYRPYQRQHNYPHARHSPHSGNHCNESHRGRKTNHHHSHQQDTSLSSRAPQAASPSHGIPFVNEDNTDYGALQNADAVQPEKLQQAANANDDEKKETTSKSAKAIAFEQHLQEYRQHHDKKYIAPFVIRRLRSEFDKECKLKEADTDGQDDDAHHPAEYVFFREWFTKHSEYYSRWEAAKSEARNSEPMESYWSLKYKNQDKQSRSSEQNIVPLFRRFYRYAIDIENVCGYRRHLVSFMHASNLRNVYFLDIGFAPGGMSRLLLDAHDNVYGAGISLPPYESGNVYVSELLSNRRYVCREHDIVALAKKVKHRWDFMRECLGNDYSTQNASSLSPVWRTEFAGFDLVIVGITCHEDRSDAERVNVLHQIWLSELYIAFLTLCDGGSVLIRHYAASDCIHLHILYIFLQCFDAYTVGKPLTEFAINKTFWICWKGFQKEACTQLQLISKLRQLVLEYDGQAPAYVRSPKTRQYFNPSMTEKTPQQIVDEVGDSILDVMEPMFETQMKCLNSFSEGKKNNLCAHRERCRRTNCTRAHAKDECMDGFFEAVLKVDEVMQSEICSHKHVSPILAELAPKSSSMRRKNEQHWKQ